jgi:hypothetical protein
LSVHGSWVVYERERSRQRFIYKSSCVRDGTTQAPTRSHHAEAIMCMLVSSESLCSML